VRVKIFCTENIRVKCVSKTVFEIFALLSPLLPIYYNDCIDYNYKPYYSFYRFPVVILSSDHLRNFR